jgi:hypothetical protein
MRAQLICTRLTPPKLAVLAPLVDDEEGFAVDVTGIIVFCVTLLKLDEIDPETEDNELEIWELNDDNDEEALEAEDDLEEAELDIDEADEAEDWEDIEDDLDDADDPDDPDEADDDPDDPLPLTPRQGKLP